MEKSFKIGFVGCGKMASAIIKGIINTNLVDIKNIKASEFSEDLAKEKENLLGITVYHDNDKLISESDIIFFATKPNQLEKILQDTKAITQDKLLVSICAGIKISKIEKYYPKNAIIRVMPNAPLMVQSGMSAIVKGKTATDENVKIVKQILDALGKSIITTEEKIDIITAISGSGPAFFYKMIHELALAGNKLGMDYNEALLLAEQTAVGSAKLMMQSNLTPTELINNISTKGGCTEVGVSVMNKYNTEKIFDEVIEQTTIKAKALG